MPRAFARRREAAIITSGDTCTRRADCSKAGLLGDYPYGVFALMMCANSAHCPDPDSRSTKLRAVGGSGWYSRAIVDNVTPMRSAVLR